MSHYCVPEIPENDDPNLGRLDGLTNEAFIEYERGLGPKEILEKMRSYHPNYGWKLVVEEEFAGPLLGVNFNDGKGWYQVFEIWE